MSESAYFDAMRELDENLDENLSHIRAEAAEGHITLIEAATERCALLERHIRECRQLRAEHLGVSIPPIDGPS